MSNRTEGVVLIGRKDSEYWFIDSVFRHDDDLFGCTGTTAYPVSKEDAEDAMSPDNLANVCRDYWAESVKESVKEGSADGGHESLFDFCDRVAETDGYGAVFDFPGQAYQEAMEEKLGPLEFADTSGGGRIFTRSDALADFDEVYNRKALVACLAYEDGAVGYDYACRVIFG